MPTYRIEYIPAHRYQDVSIKPMTENGEIWPGHDCALLSGIVSSIGGYAPDCDRPYGRLDVAQQ